MSHKPPTDLYCHIWGHAARPGVRNAGLYPSGQSSSSLRNSFMLDSDGALARPTSDANSGTEASGTNLSVE